LRQRIKAAKPHWILATVLSHEIQMQADFTTILRGRKKIKAFVAP
jgi:hypothetical protein